MRFTDLKQYLTKKKEKINQYLETYLPPEDDNPTLIHKAMRYSVLNGGKRIRPILTIMAAELLGVNDYIVMPTACGIEFIHNFSLIHDDLPCMDNDDYRRGNLTTHKAFDEATAILAGDALLVLGLDNIRKNMDVREISADTVLLVLQDILEMLGTNKMLGGQMDDIYWHNQKNNPHFIRDIYAKKTAALLCSSLKAGGLLAGANQEQLNRLSQYGYNFGMTFQITDDLLDLQQDQQDSDKPTFPEIFGMEQSRIEAQHYCQAAKENVKIFGKKAALFLDLADFVLDRKK